MSAINTKTGAGGSWKVIDEIADSSVIKQQTSYSCVAAVGEMLLKDRGIFKPQQEIIDIIGEPSNGAALAVCLNELDESKDGEKWHSLIIKRKDVSVLLQRGTFGAVLRDGSTLGHMVLIQKFDTGKLIVNDPWDGMRYKMSFFEFFRHWNGEVIFKWNL